jgi:hypothetical protein
MALKRYSDANTAFSKIVAMGATGTALTIAQWGTRELEAWHKNADDSRTACQKVSGVAAIAACGRAIESGKFEGADLAVIYANRCFEHYRASDYERSLADCDAAIGIEPTRGYYHF